MLGVHLLLKLFVMACVFFVMPFAITGIEVRSFGSAALAALVLSFLNIFLKPLLVLLTLPFTLVTFGLFLFVVNGIMLYIVGYLLPGIEVRTFWAGIQGAFLLTVAEWLFQWGASPKKGRVRSSRYAHSGGPMPAPSESNSQEPSRSSGPTPVIDLKHNGDRWE